MLSVSETSIDSSLYRQGGTGVQNDSLVVFENNDLIA